MATGRMMMATAAERKRNRKIRLTRLKTKLISISFSYNIGIETFTQDDGFDEDTVAAAIYTATLGFGLTDSLGAFLEIYGEIGLSAGGSPRHLFDGGFTYLVRDNVQLDIVAGIGISDPADDWFVGIGVSFRLPG